MGRMKYTLIVLFLMAFCLSCASDIILEPPPSLKGDYAGRYIWTNIQQQVSREQNVVWRFTDRDWFMTADSTDVLDECFCISFGQYSVEEKVRLLNVSPQLPDTGCTGGTCDPSLSPNGSFDLRQPPDSIVLSYLSADGDTLKEVFLER